MQATGALRDVTVSQYIETPPAWPSPADAPPFLNAALVGWTALDARALVGALLAIEQERGRERPYAGAPRPLDLDLILLGDLRVQEPGLEVPHPRFRDRLFVLDPLASIAPDVVDPVTGKTVGELRDRALARSIRT